MKKYDWNYLIRFNFNAPKNEELIRDNNTQIKYEKYKKINEFKNSLFKKKNIFKFVKNRFPYNVNNKIKHYLLFINPLVKINFKYDDIYDIIRLFYVKRKPIIIFENEMEYRSIKDIRHYHIFILDDK